MTTNFTPKHPDILELMKSTSKLVGGCGVRTSGLCIMCPRSFDPATEFKDELSQREYEISGMCQKCQNSVFGGGERDEVSQDMED